MISDRTCQKFNELTSREKWEQYDQLDCEWLCPKCKTVLIDGPYRSIPFHSCSIHCDKCDTELSRRTGGGQLDPFRWIAADPNRPICSCGGFVEYFGEALMGSLTCNNCEEFLMGVGSDFLKSIKERWINGDRGYIETEH